MSVPADPLIFHITHVANLRGIVSAGGLMCDARCVSEAVPYTNIGHRHIKQRRLSRRVMTRSRGTLGDYVPFNFCPRSVMLYAVQAGHQDYRGGQDSVVHLVSSVSRAVATGQPWAFTDRHAELAHALYFEDLGKLSEVHWHVMGKQYWQDVKEERQAEFLVHDFFPWTALGTIAVKTPESAETVRQIMQSAAYQPPVVLQPDWYY